MSEDDKSNEDHKDRKHTHALQLSSELLINPELAFITTSGRTFKIKNWEKIKSNHKLMKKLRKSKINLSNVIVNTHDFICEIIKKPCYFKNTKKKKINLIYQIIVYLLLLNNTPNFMICNTIYLNI